MPRLEQEEEEKEEEEKGEGEEEEGERVSKLITRTRISHAALHALHNTLHSTTQQAQDRLSSLLFLLAFFLLSPLPFFSSSSTYSAVAPLLPRGGFTCRRPLVVVCMRYPLLPRYHTCHVILIGEEHRGETESNTTNQGSK